MPNTLESKHGHFTPEEGQKVADALKVFLDEHQADLIVAPIINPNGTIGAEVKLFKKVEIESPYVEADGETPTETAKEA